METHIVDMMLNIELHYNLNPKEVHGEDFPGETFRVLKEKEVRLYEELKSSDLLNQ